MAREQDTVAGAKLDSVVLVGPTSITQDDSQFLTDLVAQGAGAVETSSARAAITGPRTTVVRWAATAAEASVILAVHGNQAKTDGTWVMLTSPSGELAIFQNGAPLFVADSAVAAKDYTFSWTLRANPDAAGASDASISTVVCYNHTDSVLEEIEQITHATPTTDVAWDLSVGGWWDGATLTQAPTNAVDLMRVSRGPHAPTEVVEDWVSARTAYAGAAADAPSEPAGPIPVSSGMADVGLWAGRHPWGWSAAHANGTERRNWAPLANEVYSSTPEVNMATAANWLAQAPDSPTFVMGVQYLRWVSAPAGATHARVRVHAHVNEATIQVRLRCYAFNRLPQQQLIGGQPAPALEYYWREVTILRNDGATDGEWSDLGLVRLPAFAGAASGWPGTVHLALAWEIDPIDNEDIVLEIKAWHVVPVFQSMIGVFDP